MKNLKKLYNTILEDISGWENIKDPKERLIKKFGLSLNKEGKYQNWNRDIKITDADLINGHFPIKFGRVEAFNCNNCKTLTSLQGAPEFCMHFDCSGCDKLTSLDGSPLSITGHYSCKNCNGLTSLKGATQNVSMAFHCDNCGKLQTLEGAPSKVWDFTATNCTKLRTLKGGPSIVKGGMWLNGCTNLMNLEGCPNGLREKLVLDGCTGLISLDGAPIEVFDLYINNCINLRDFGNSLQTIGRDLFCKNCPKIDKSIFQKVKGGPWNGKVLYNSPKEYNTNINRKNSKPITICGYLNDENNKGPYN